MRKAIPPGIFKSLARGGIVRAAARNVTPPIVIKLFERASLLYHRRSAGAIGPHSKLHFGCGSNIKPGWINIDLSRCADIRLDLGRPLPIRDEVASIVYSEHFLEHLEYPQAAELFVRECFRILEKGGRFSVGVPDTEWPLKSYAGDHDYLREARARKWHPQWCVTEMEHINCHFREGGHHLFAYDFETLKLFLERSGFVDIRRREPDLTLDLKERAYGTLYVDAKKV